MPSTKRRIVQKTPQPKTDSLEDEEIPFAEANPIINKPKTSSKKDIPITSIVSETISDNLSKTLAYGIAGNMLKSVGEDYAITPPEAYNIFHPAFGIAKHYTPNIVLSTKIPPDVADNLTLIVTTVLEYFTRVTVIAIEKIFKLQVRQVVPQQPRQQAQPMNQNQYPQNRRDSIVPPQPMTQEDLQELFPLDQAQNQSLDDIVPMAPTGAKIDEMIQDGYLVGDTGQSLA